MDVGVDRRAVVPPTTTGGATAAETAEDRIALDDTGGLCRGDGCASGVVEQYPPRLGAGNSDFGTRLAQPVPVRLERVWAAEERLDEVLRVP